MQTLAYIKRVLISVSNKNDILNFANNLCQRGIELMSTGGTAQFLIKNGLTVTEVSHYTNFPEIMNGRIKTLHPKIHGGILGRRDIDYAIMKKYGIIPIDMVVVNLYPFHKVITKIDCCREEAIENIDIGGSAMIRAAAKNYKNVTVVVDITDYSLIIKELDCNQGCLAIDTRFNLAVKAFEYIARYDSSIANYFGNQVPVYGDDHNQPSGNFPRTINLNFIKKQNIRYGENKHQLAALYTDIDAKEASVVTATQLQGKTLSYNNIIDADTALECVKSFTEIACVIVKHANPCGVAVADTLFNAYNLAYQTDPISAFGGVVSFNRSLDAFTAKEIIKRQFVEVIIVPSIENDALAILANKRNLRVLICGHWEKRLPGLDFKRINNGLLIQERDLGIIDSHNLKVMTKRQPTQEEIQDSLFCWKVAKFVKSNAIVFARNQRTLGIGAGQMSRIYSAKIAAIKANDEGLDINNSVMASDAFLPFSDTIDIAAKVGVCCIIQPGGSINDDKIINVANKYNIAMIFTKMRHFRH